MATGDLLHKTVLHVGSPCTKLQHERRHYEKASDKLINNLELLKFS